MFPYCHSHMLLTLKSFGGLTLLKAMHCSPIPPLKHNNSFISDNFTKANVLNQYFFSVFTIKDYTDLPSL